MLLTADKLVNGTSVLDFPVVEIQDGRIASIDSRTAGGELPAASGIELLDFPGATLAPAFFDVHIHGGAGHDAMEATPQALTAMGRLLASHGTGSYLATTVTAPLDATLRSLEVANSSRTLRARSNPLPGRSAFIWKGRFCRTPSAACIRRSCCSRPTSASSTGSMKLPRAMCGS
jgi:N-acetylglucosamine-6-phosphate deacetylase